ncbi:hypothetical protein V6N13_149105 [Hibiscus sabdariffa]
MDSAAKEFGGLGLIDSIYEPDQSCLLPTNTKPSNKYWIWRQIVSPLELEDNLVSRNISFVVGDGKRLKFWTDKWISSEVLKISFPCIFALALNKDGVIASFGEFVERVWQWNIALRRRLFDWELASWTRFGISFRIISLGLISRTAFDGLLALMGCFRSSHSDLPCWIKG